MGKQRNREEFEKDLKCVTSTIKLVGDFKSVDSYMTFECTKDSKQFDRHGFYILKYPLCPFCLERERNALKEKEKNDFLVELHKKYPNFELVSDYKSEGLKVKIKCSLDGKTFCVTPLNLLNTDVICPKCSKIPKLSQQEFESRVYDHLKHIEILGEYKTCDTRVKCRCKIHNLEFESLPEVLYKGNVICPKCAGKRTNEEFLEELKLVNPNVTPLEDYCFSGSKIKVKCNIDGHIWRVAPINLLKGIGCPICAGNYVKSEDVFLGELKNKDSKFEIKSKYNGYCNPIDVKCLACGDEFTTTPQKLIYQKYGCMKCANVKKKTHEEFVSQLYERYSNLEVLDKYKNTNTRLLMKCKECGRNFYGVPQQMLIGIGCPHCRISHLAKDIRSFLENNSISHKAEYRIKECRYKRPLPFDFAIFKDNILISLIEADGRQHYESIEYFGGNKAFKLQQIKDKIKTDYCIAHSIPLIRIPHTEIKNIPEILQKELIEKYNI
ncbi:MAG: hypothetical protein RR413_10055 [Christensenellaceae bacterium]